MNRKLRLVIVTSAAAVVAVYGCFWLIRPMSCSEAAKAALRATEMRDGGELWSLTPPEERTLYGLTRERMQALLDKSGYGTAIVPSGKMLEQDNATDGSVTINRWYRLNGKSDGLSGLTAEVRRRHEVYVKQPITTLIYMMIYSVGLREVTGPKPLVYVKGLPRARAILESLGFKGAANPTCDRIETWAELQSQFLTRWDRYQTRRAER